MGLHLSGQRDDAVVLAFLLCDVVVTSIDDALDLLLKTGRLRATLRT